ncbi:hypothetical protein [Anaerosalibacter sp. Marseille-P3206]|uniref:hypothetical protein n=1 Tax=Anaerosalibacter sp. Marseille-P3206 TaxID=1871005 RepID=UPI00350F849B
MEIIRKKKGKNMNLLNVENMVLLRKYEEAINNPNTPSEEIVRLTHQMDAMVFLKLDEFFPAKEYNG